MNTPTCFSQLVAFLSGFLAVGIPYWAIPYREVGLPNSLFGLGLWVVGISAFLLRGVARAGLVRALVVTSAAVPGAVIARIAVEVVRDPTSHNLWPIEVVLATGVGLFCAGVGLVPGSLLLRVLDRDV